MNEVVSEAKSTATSFGDSSADNTEYVVYCLETDEIMTTTATIPLVEGRYYPVFNIQKGIKITNICIYLGAL